MSRTFAYARVSTIEQTPENQLQEIAAAGFKVEPHRIVAETVSGSVAIARRKGFSRLLDKMERDDVGPWVDGDDEETDDGEQDLTSTLRSRRREARAMRTKVAASGSEAVRPEDIDRDDGVSPEWEELLDRQESFIEDLLGV